MKEYQLLKDLAYEYNADVGLSYASPVRGVWNIVHIGTLVPQSHEIFVCPTSCLRGVVLTTAEMGAMDRLSTITVGEDNILEGDMEEALYRGTKRIIQQLPARPRAMLIYTSCIHHFMAVNYKRIYRLLAEEYPDIDFIDCYMDPIMRRTAPAVPSLWRQIHRLLKPVSVKKDQVNLVGNCFRYGPYSDLNRMLERSGIRVMDVNTCRDYDEFLEMSASRMNFVFHKTGLRAVKDMQVRLQQDWIMMRSGYLYEEIDEDMAKAAEALGIRPLSPEEIRMEQTLTDQKIRETKELYADTPVSLDYTAVDKPLELALFLQRNGFVVDSVFLDVITESQEIFEQLKCVLPDLRIYQSVGWNIRQMSRGHEGKVVAIGQKSAYFNDTDYFVNIVENDGMYGYLGIRRLMDLMQEALKEPKPMKELVQIKGWGCSCG